MADPSGLLNPEEKRALKNASLNTTQSMTAEEWGSVVFSNCQFNKYPEVMKQAERLPVTMTKRGFGILSLSAMAFNCFTICNNLIGVKWKFNKDDYLDSANGKLFVFTMEFAGLALMLLWLIFHLIRSRTCRTGDKYLGENATVTAQVITMISFFSLVRGLADIKRFFSHEWEFWVLTKTSKASKCNKWSYFTAGTMIRILWILGSVLSFFLKCTQIDFLTQPAKVWTKDYYNIIAFVGFINNMINLYTPSQMNTRAIYRFVFAGQDALFQANEEKMLNEFIECVNYRIVKKKNWLDGMCMVLVFGAADFQKIMIKHVEIGDVGEIDDNMVLGHDNTTPAPGSPSSVHLTIAKDA